MTRDVLVIDDSATVRKLVEISLRGRPFRAHFADSGRDGIQRAAALAPAAILLDFVLPDMTGVDVCRALAADPRTKGIPILVVTAKHERTRGELRPFPAVVDFIAKPFAAPDLLARIDRAITGAPTGVAVGTTAATLSAAPRAEGTRPVELRADATERAARLLYARLKDGLALIPAQLRGLEPGPIAPQLARRLLSPQVVDGILADLRQLIEGDGGGRAGAPGEPVAGEVVIDRVPGFSAKLPGAQLTAIDRRILALTDGKLTVGELAVRIAADPAAVGAVVADLVARGLVREVHAGARPRPVVICEPDLETFQAPLRALLAQRATPRELVAVDRFDQVADATRKHQACLVMVNATGRVADACAVAQVLRRERDLADLAMVAVLEARAGPAPELAAAGFDATFAKPVSVHELERFLTPADLR